jgi:hypothetical protein
MMVQNGEAVALGERARVAVTEGEGGRLRKAWSKKENVFPAKTRPTRGLDGPAGRLWPAANGAASGLAGLRGRVGRKVGRAEIKKKNFWIKNWIFEFTQALEICRRRFRRNFDMRIFPKFF